MTRRYWVLAAVLALDGCVGSGGWKSAPEIKPAALKTEQTLSAATRDPAAWPVDTWWRGYRDAQLDALVDEALAGSPSLEIAQARLRLAQAQAVAAHAARVPAVTLNAELTRQRYPETGLYPPPYAGNYSNSGQATLDLSYELDFWGRNRALLAAALSGVQAQEADRAAARLALAVSVVQAYIQLDLAYALLDVADEQLTQQVAILDLTQQRVTTGLETTARVKQSEATVALTRAGVAAVQANIDLARNQLADLVGAGPDRGQSIKRPQLVRPSSIALPSVLPADLLGRRPDVAAARAEVEAASHGRRAAEAAFYPNVNLTAFAGFQSIVLSQLFNGSNHIVGITPALSLPVFNRDQLRGELYARQAQIDQSIGQYNQTLLDAIRQVADVVANWRALELETEQEEIALAAAQRAYDLTTERYRAGLDNYLSVLSTQNQVLLTEAVRAELQARRLTFSVNLVQALGGGYSASAPAG